MKINRRDLLAGLAAGASVPRLALREKAWAAPPEGRVGPSAMKVDLVQDLPWTKSHGAMTNWENHRCAT